jgi:hypothetical protein
LNEVSLNALQAGLESGIEGGALRGDVEAVYPINVLVWQTAYLDLDASSIGNGKIGRVEAGKAVSIGGIEGIA